MSGNISFKYIASLSVIIVSLLVFSSMVFSDHTQTTTLLISGTPVANWTESNTTNLYNFSIQANESINITTINIPAVFTLNDSTINSSGYPAWTCQNTSNTVECITSGNTTTSIDIWFNTTSQSITDETIYTWYINTTDYNSSTTNSTGITTGVDGKAPQVIAAGTTLNADLNATGTSYIFLTVNVSDSNIASVKINLSSLGGSNETAMTKNNSIYYYNISGNIALISGLKTLGLNLTDSFGHYNDTGYINLTIYDITAPSVSLTSNQPVDADNIDELIFYATVIDTELNNVKINLTELGGAGDQQMYNDGTHGDTNGSDTTWTFNMTVPETFNDGNYNVYVNATDNSGNCNDTQSRTITVVDVTGPYVKDMASTLSVVPADDTNITLTVNVTDLEGLHLTGLLEDVFIDLSSIGGDSSQVMYDDGGFYESINIISNDTTSDDDIYSWIILITDTVQSGTYYLNITATDTNSNINDTEYIEINVTDVTIPKAYWVNLTKTQVNATGADYTTITANISDLETNNVYANLSNVGGNATQILYDDGTNGDTSPGDGIFSFTFTVPNSINNGTHSIGINATDRSGNYNDTLSISIDVIDTDAPTITINTPANSQSYSNATNLINISTDEQANVTYSIDGGPYVLLYNLSTEGTVDFPQSNWTEGTHNITINATDAYCHYRNLTNTFNLRPDLNITSVYLANSSALYTGDTTTINATIEAYGFNVSNATINFYVDSVLLSSQTYNCTCNITEPVTIESTASWNVTSKTHYFSANITWTSQTESDTSNNGLMNTTFIQDFETNITTELDFGTIAVAGISTRSINLTNSAQINQSAITETITLSKLYTFSYNFTRLEKKSFYFAVPANTTTNDITVSLQYNTSLGTVTYTQPTANAPGISRLDIDAKEMNLSSLPVNITVEIGLDEIQWIQSDFNTTQAIENKSSEVFTYNLTIPDNIPSGNYTGTITYENENNSISSNITFSVTAPELWIASDVKESPVQTSSATYTFYANAESGIKNYSLIIKNNNGGTLNGVFLNFSSLNFTKGNENITVTLTNGTDGVTVDENNATFTGITAETNKSVILSFNVSNHTTGTYSTTFNLTSSNGEPIENYSVTLQLIIDNTLGLSMTHSSVPQLYPGNTTTFEVDVAYRDGSPVTGLNSSNITALAIRNGASQSIISYLNNFTEQSPGIYLLNITLPSSMAGGDIHLDLTVSTGTYSGTYTEDIRVYAPYLAAPYWTSSYSPSDINIYTFGTGYDTYNISIKNNGLESSGTMTATISTCGASYLALVDDAAQAISSIPAGGTGTARWRVDPIANKTGCVITVTVTGGKFWFSETSASVSKTIDITNSQTVIPPEEEADEDTPSLLSTCDVSACDYDEKCIDGICTHFDCDNGYYSNHECVKYVYSINFTSVPENLEIVQGNTSSFRIYYKNTGNRKIEDFTFTLEGLDNTSSYKVVTNLPDKILDDEPQDVVILLNISSDAPVGRHNITVWFRSDKLTTSKTFILSILPDAESIAEIEKWMPELEKDIEDLKESFDKIKDSINGTNYTFLNDTLHRIDILYAEAKNATLSGDFLTAYERKAQIEALIAQANALMSDQPLKQGGTLKYMTLAILLIILSIGAYIFYDQSRSDGYHIFKGLSISHLKQMRLISFLSSARRQSSSRMQRHISAGKVNINSYHHMPTFEVRLLRAMHSLRHRINLKLESMHSHQIKLDSRRFIKRPGAYTPTPPARTVAPSYAPARRVHNTAIHTNATHAYHPAHTQPAVRPVSKMMKHFERSKTRCGICGKDFRNIHELELHRKYSHRSLHRK